MNPKSILCGKNAPTCHCESAADGRSNLSLNPQSQIPNPKSKIQNRSQPHRYAASLLCLCGILLIAGCTEPAVSLSPSLSAPLGTDRQTAMTAAENTLTDMHFEIEKSDTKAGLIRTYPLSSAQFFEFWRDDTVGSFNSAEANMDTVDRIVELQLQPQTDGRLCFNCSVYVRKLYLPQRQITSAADAAGMFSSSSGSLQKFRLSKKQQAEMTWLDMGRDKKLEQKIIEKINFGFLQ